MSSYILAQYKIYTLDFFGNHRQKIKYKLIVEQSDNQGLDDIFKMTKSVPVLGTEKFLKLIKEQYLQEEHIIAEIPEHKLLTTNQSIDIEIIVQTVAKFYGINEKELTLIKKRNGNQPRNIAIFLAHTIGYNSFSQISSYFRNITASGASRVCQRLKIKMDGQLKEEIARIKKILMDMSIVETRPLFSFMSII